MGGVANSRRTVSVNRASESNSTEGGSFRSRPDMDLTIDPDDLYDLLIGRRTAAIIVGYLTDHQRRAIGAYSPVVWLSRETAIKTEVKHRRRDLDLYQLTPTILRKGDARRTAPRHLVFLYSRIAELDRPYKAIVKSTQDGRENFLCSVHRIEPRQIKTTLARSTPIAAG